MDPKQMMESMRAQLERDEASGDLAGLTVDDLSDAMSHPLASETVAELLALEPQTVQQGEPAPDFTLPYLPGHGGAEGETVTLSAHRGRPVALVFGSYT